MKSKKGKKINIPVIILYFFVIIFIGYIIWQFLLHSPQDAPLAGGKKRIIDFPWTMWEIFLYAHILGGAIAFAIGPFQFLTFSHRKQLHRTLGKIYVTSIFFSVPFGCYLAFYASGGIPSTISFIVLDLVWFFTTFIGLKRIQERNILAHQEWMIRSYATTWVFVTFRIEMPFGILGFGFQTGYTLAVWTALIGNLLVAEWLLKRKRKQQTLDRTLVT